MFYISNITHEGQVSEEFQNAKRVGELVEKLSKHLSWNLGSVNAVIDESDNKITIEIANRDNIITVLDEAEVMIKELRETLNKIEEQEQFVSIAERKRDYKHEQRFFSWSFDQRPRAPDNAERLICMPVYGCG